MSLTRRIEETRFALAGWHALPVEARDDRVIGPAPDHVTDNTERLLAGLGAVFVWHGLHDTKLHVPPAFTVDHQHDLAGLVVDTGDGVLTECPDRGHG
ncbi:MAG: hypothetical protein AAGA32_16120 [Pseudomonadota bacterium]